MSDERKLILRMLKEGKISEEEALKLLDAIGNKETSSQMGAEFNEQSFETKAQNFAEGIVNTLDQAFKKIGDKLGQIDIGYDFDIDLGPGRRYSFNNFKSRLTKVYTAEVSDEISKLYVENKNGQIQIKESQDDVVSIEVDFKYDERYIDEAFDPITYEIVEGQLEILPKETKNKKEKFIADLIVSLPRNKNWKQAEIKTSNGKLSIQKLKASNMQAKSNNGKIELESVEADQVKVKTTNGGISVIGVSASELEISAINGQILLDHNLAKDIQLDSVNGALEVTVGLDTQTLSASTVNGRVNLEVQDINRPMRAELYHASKGNSDPRLPSVFTQIEKVKDGVLASTDNYEEDSQLKLDLKASTVNGRIDII